MTNRGKYYITTAIAYTSGKPHIGNSYEIVLADSIARFKRQQGYEVFFQTGTDEHGQKIEQKAAEAGITPKQFVDNVAGTIKGLWDLMDTSYDKFIRTTDDYHEKQIQKIFKKLYEQGDIYKGHYEGLYCTPCESFWTESQLVDGKCPDCGREVKPAKEEAYFLKLSKYADRLIEHINTHPEFIQPVSRKNEMMNNFLLPGLQDLCVSRTSFKWGIPVDFDDKHIVYVWLDALSNYITGIGYDCDGNNSDLFKKMWPADLHLIGKDIIRFHTIYWPIILMALDLPLPKQVFGHPWLLQGDGKMSKSKGNVLYADTLVDFFGVDAVRYFVLHEMPFENDGVISWELMIERFNSDLANVLGNLVSRTISMSNKYFGGVVENTGVKEEVDDDLISVVTAAKGKEEAYTLSNNVARYETIDEARYMDDMALKAWKDHPNRAIIGNENEFEVKMVKAIQSVFEYLGEGAPIQKFNRYLVNVDEDVLKKIKQEAGFSTSHIIQHYLRSDDGYERRIRSRDRNGDMLYSYSEANYLSTNERVKVDRVLTEKQYNDFAHQIDTDLHVIDKMRYSFIDKSLFFKLEVFDFDTTKGILTVDEPDDGRTVEVPDYFEVIRDVTGDVNYKNYYLAKSQSFNV